MAAIIDLQAVREQRASEAGERERLHVLASERERDLNAIAWCMQHAAIGVRDVAFLVPLLEALASDARREVTPAEGLQLGTICHRLQLLDKARALRPARATPHNPGEPKRAG